MRWIVGGLGLFVVLGCGGMFYAPVELRPLSGTCGLLEVEATRQAAWADSVPLRVDGETVHLIDFDPPTRWWSGSRCAPACTSCEPVAEAP